MVGINEDFLIFITQNYEGESAVYDTFKTSNTVYFWLKLICIPHVFPNLVLVITVLQWGQVFWASSLMLQVVSVVRPQARVSVGSRCLISVLSQGTGCP